MTGRCPVLEAAKQAPAYLTVGIVCNISTNTIGVFPNITYKVLSIVAPSYAPLLWNQKIWETDTISTFRLGHTFFFHKAYSQAWIR